MSAGTGLPPEARSAWLAGYRAARRRFPPRPAVMIVGFTGVLVRLVTRHKHSTAPGAAAFGGSNLPPAINWQLSLGTIAAVFAVGVLMARVVPARLRVIPLVYMVFAAAGGIVLVLLELGLAAGLK